MAPLELCGQPFDPNVAEAIAQVGAVSAAAQGHAPGSVCQVLQEGCECRRHHHHGHCRRCCRRRRRRRCRRRCYATLIRLKPACGALVRWRLADMMHDRVLRPARVMVVEGDPPPAAVEAEAEAEAADKSVKGEEPAAAVAAGDMPADKQRPAAPVPGATAAAAAARPPGAAGE